MADQNQSVVIQMSAADAELVAAWQNARKGPQALEKELEKVGKAGKKAGADTAAGMQQASQAAQNLGSKFQALSASAKTVADLVRQEFDAIQAKQAEALGSVVSIAAAQRKAMAALPSGGDLSPGELLAMTQQSRVPIGDTLAAMAAGLKEGGKGFSSRRAADTALAAGELSPVMASGDRDALTSAAITLQKGTPSLSPKEAVAQVLAIAGRSEGSLGQVATSTIPGVANLSKFAGGTPTQFAALINSFEGAVEGSSPQQAAQTTAKVVGKLASEGEASGAFKRGASLDSMLTAARGNPKLRAAVLGSIRDPAARAAARDLLEGGGEVSSSFAKLRGEMAGSPAEVLRQQEAGAATAGKLTGVSTAAQELDVLRELSLTGGEKALRGLADKGFTTAQELAGRNDPARDVRWAGRAIGAPFRGTDSYVGSTSAEIRSIGQAVSTAPGGAELKATLETIAKKLDEQTALMREQGRTPQPVEVKRLPAGNRSKSADSSAIDG